MRSSGPDAKPAQAARGSLHVSAQLAVGDLPLPDVKGDAAAAPIADVPVDEVVADLEETRSHRAPLLSPVNAVELAGGVVKYS